jgi:flagellar protein FlaG
MALDIATIASISNPIDIVRVQSARVAASENRQAAKKQPADLGVVTSDLQHVGATLNRRLSFSVNEKLGQVVVKVIDADTDKVVKEIPPEELQHVYERIREVIGLLLDKQA